MSFPAYPKYRDSGIEWLGEVPEEWNLRPIKWLGKIQYGIGEPPKYQETGTPLVRATNVDRGALKNKGLVYVNPDHIPTQRVVWLESGDIIVVRSGANTGDSAIIPKGYGEAIAGFDMVLRASSADSEYLQYCLLSTYLRKFQLEIKSMRAAQPHLNAVELGECLVPTPPLPEQRAIAQFLDSETSKIDALVAEQRRLIELLKEKRQAVISHAVTKGLNPNAKMKPSGIEWLGDVPEHWEVIQLRYLTAPQKTITYGIVQAGPDVDGGVPYIRTSDMSKDYFPGKGYLRTSSNIDRAYARSRVCPGDLVVAIRASLGKGLLVPEFLRGANLTQGTARVSPGQRITSRFLFWAFNSSYCQSSIDRVAKGTTFLEITLSRLRRISLVVPPKEEQVTIVGQLDTVTTKIDSLSHEAEKTIALLQERRTALISAAVTGKIDVRDYEKTVT